MGVAGTAFRVDRRDVDRPGSTKPWRGTERRFEAAGKVGVSSAFFILEQLVAKVMESHGKPALGMEKGADASIEIFRKSFVR